MRRARDLIKDYPDEALLEEVQRVAELVDKPVLTIPDFQRHSGVDSTIVRRRFGGWPNVLERAGLAHMFDGQPDDVARPSRKYSDDELLEEIRRVAGLVNKPTLTRIDFENYSQIGVSTLSHRFGSWVGALERAGLGNLQSPATFNAHYSDEDMLEEVRRVAKLVDKRVLTTTDFDKHCVIHSHVIARRLGGWKSVLERAGLGQMLSDPPNRVYWDEELGSPACWKARTHQKRVQGSLQGWLPDTHKSIRELEQGVGACGCGTIVFRRRQGAGEGT